MASAADESDFLWQFWMDTLAVSRGRAEAAIRQPMRGRLRSVAIDDVTFSGYEGQSIRAWFVRPRDHAVPLPTVIEYIGYGGGRGYSHEHLLWASCGFAHLVMDVRGQGSVTPDVGPPSRSGDSYFTRGLHSPETYYYRRLYTDAVLAVDAVRTFAEVDRSAIAVTGGSQGGGTALAVAALRNDLVAVMPDVPAMGAYRTAMAEAEVGPYVAVAEYLAVHREEVEQGERTLNMFDTAILCPRATAPALFSLGGRDVVVPPSSIREVFDAYGGPKELVEYPYNGHEGGGAPHAMRQIEWLSALLERAGTTRVATDGDSGDRHPIPQER